jgi:Ca-activated chloride channel family protein
MNGRHSNLVFWLLGLVVVAAIGYCLVGDDCSLLTPDQQAHRLFEEGDYETAAADFADPMWRGVALFRQGEFEQTAGVFAGFDTAEAAFNQGNALIMLGKYDEAVGRYERTLELRPDWEPAIVNRNIAVTRAERLKQEGGDMTGGMLGADDIVFSDKKSPPSDQTEQTDGGQPMSEEEMRAIWLRQVTTKPADFLRAKFAYQQKGDQNEPLGIESALPVQARRLHDKKPRSIVVRASRPHIADRPSGGTWNSGR